jgi:hypothetical protein
MKKPKSIHRWGLSLMVSSSNILDICSSAFSNVFRIDTEISDAMSKLDPSTIVVT